MFCASGGSRVLGLEVGATTLLWVLPACARVCLGRQRDGSSYSLQYREPYMAHAYSVELCGIAVLAGQKWSNISSFSCFRLIV